MWALGLSLLCYWSWSQAAIRFEQARLEESLFGAEASPAAATDDALSNSLPSTAPNSTAPVLEHGSPVALLEIPRVDLRAMVVEGVDAQALERAAGHLPGTALPGESGNSVVAAHRDTLFSGLRHVRLGDRITVRTERAAFTYLVSAIDLVTPRSLHVLDPTPHPSLTLITCFPFDFVGPAPLRFVVSATREGAVTGSPEPPSGGERAVQAATRGRQRPLDPRLLSLLFGSPVEPGFN